MIRFSQFGLAALVAVALAPCAAAQEFKAQPSWWYRSVEAQVGYYWVKTDLPPEQADVLARHLNLMYGEYAACLANVPARAPAPLNVLLFADRADYEETLRRRYGVDAVATGGMFFVKPKGTALALWTGGLSPRRVRHVLQHEGFHQFAYSRFGTDLPLWVEEGLAEVFGSSVVVDGDLLVGQVSALVLDAIRSAIGSDAHVPFDRMLTMTTEQWAEAIEDGSAPGLYAQSWSMVHFLIYGDDGRYRDRFARYLRLVNAGYLSRDSFVRAFETDDFDAFERGWKAYVASASPSSFITALERMEFLAEASLALSRQGVLPASLEEFQEALLGLDFSRPRPEHAGGGSVQAGDWVFTIPPTGASREGGYEPIFLVERPRRLDLTRRERALEQARPTPSVIETKYLRPRDLALRWERGEDGESFTYDILVR
jgi:hypothetical protein